MEVQADEGAMVFALRGELDLSVAPRLVTALDAARAAGHERMVLEMGELDFIDGTSVGLIERTQRELRADGVELTIRHARGRIRRVMELYDGFRSGKGPARLRPPGEGGRPAPASADEAAAPTDATRVSART
jgi:anti-anti-sigma factor